jgi:hypothetical protein
MSDLVLTVGMIVAGVLLGVGIVMLMSSYGATP